MLILYRVVLYCTIAHVISVLYYIVSNIGDGEQFLQLDCVAKARIKEPYVWQTQVDLRLAAAYVLRSATAALQSVRKLTISLDCYSGLPSH